MASRKRGRASKKGPALKAWLGEDAGEDGEAAAPEEGAKADGDAGGDAPVGDASGAGGQRAAETPAEEEAAEAAEPTEGAEEPAEGEEEGDEKAEAKDDDEKAEKEEKPDPKERLSTAWANVKRARKDLKRQQDEVTRFAQQAEQARAEAQAIVEKVRSNPLAFAQEHGIAARQLLEAAAKEEDTPPEARAVSGLEAKLDAALEEIKQLREERQQQQAQHNEHQELAELAHFLENPPDDIDVSGIQWWGTEQVAKDLHAWWVSNNRSGDLRSEIERANQFFSERMARARPASESHARPSNGASPERGNGAVQPAEPAVAAKQPPPALSNATARRPTGAAPMTRAERKRRAIEMLETR